MLATCNAFRFRSLTIKLWVVPEDAIRVLLTALARKILLDTALLLKSGIEGTKQQRIVALDRFNFFRERKG